MLSAHSPAQGAALYRDSLAKPTNNAIGGVTLRHEVIAPLDAVARRLEPFPSCC